MHEFVLITDPSYRDVIQDSLYTDVIFRVSGKQYGTNLCVCSIFSRKVREMMTDSYRKGRPLDEIELKDIEADDFELIHTLIQTGTILITPKNALPLLRMGTYFKIDYLVKYLTEMIENNDEFMESIDLFIFAYESKKQSLIETAKIRIGKLNEAPFFNENLERYISMEAFESLLRNLPMFNIQRY